MAVILRKSGKIVRRGGKIRRGEAGDPCCCTPPTIPTFPCDCPASGVCAGAKTLLIKNFGYFMFTPPGGALLTASDASNCDHGEFQHLTRDGYCWIAMNEYFEGMTQVGGFTAPMFGIKRMATDADCTNKYYVMDIYVWDPTFTTKLLVWQGVQNVANVAEDGAPYIRVAGSSLIPASVEVYCVSDCPTDGTGCADPYTVTFSLRAGGVDVMNILGGSPYTVTNVGGGWAWAAAGFGPTLFCDRGRAVVLIAPLAGGANQIWAVNTPGQLCPPAGPTDYEPLSTDASNYICRVS